MRKIYKNKKLLALTIPIALFFVISGALAPMTAHGVNGINVEPTITIDPDLIPKYTPQQSQNNNRDSEGVLKRMNTIANIAGFKTGAGSATVPQIVGLIISTIISLTGLIFIVLTVFAGFNWMSSQGNDEKIKKSQDTLKSSVIGLIITLSAWTIWNFIFRNLIL